MTFKKYFLLTTTTLLLTHLINAEESEIIPLAPEEVIQSKEDAPADLDEYGWHIVTTERFTIHFPSQPKVDRRPGCITYSSLDAGSFPVVMYLFAENASKNPIDAEEYINNYLEKASAYPMNLLSSEISEYDDEILVDTLCSDANTRVLRCERLIVDKNKAYTLTTLFFPNAAENHDYFIQNFSRN